MAHAVERIVTNMRAAEASWARGLHDHEQRWQHRLRHGRIWFDQETQAAQKQLKQSIPAFLRGASLCNLLTTPMIYSVGVAFVILDVWATLDQWICFPIYGVPHVRRGAYFIIDRHKLPYLNTIEKANCLYCSYATGVIGYVGEIAGRTEQYWCPIKHARGVKTPHAHYQLFLEYGDAAGYRREYHGANIPRRPALV